MTILGQLEHRGHLQCQQLGSQQIRVVGGSRPQRGSARSDHLGQPHHLHRRDRRHLHGDRLRLPGPDVLRDRHAADRASPSLRHGVLSGTPAAGTGGTYPITITASQRGRPQRHPELHPHGRTRPRPSPRPTSTTFTAGTAGSFTVTATGSRPHLHETGTLPERRHLQHRAASCRAPRQRAPAALPDHHHRHQRRSPPTPPRASP